MVVEGPLPQHLIQHPRLGPGGRLEGGFVILKGIATTRDFMALGQVEPALGTVRTDLHRRLEVRLGPLNGLGPIIEAGQVERPKIEMPSKTAGIEGHRLLISPGGGAPLVQFFPSRTDIAPMLGRIRGDGGGQPGRLLRGLNYSGPKNTWDPP